jgi:hypothetical protein
VTKRWEEVINRRANNSTANVNALKEGLHSLRAVCLRSFPEFLADIKQASIPKADIGIDIADVTEMVSSFCCIFFRVGSLFGWMQGTDLRLGDQILDCTSSRSGGGRGGASSSRGWKLEDG